MSTFAKIYRAYGGVKAFLTSSYLWISIFAALILFQGISERYDWIDLPIKVIPPLTGFTFASFSLLFAILDEDSRLVLSQPDEDFGGEKPILVIVSKIVHSVFVQLCALIAALLLATKPIVLPISAKGADVANALGTGIALFLFVYGLLLVFSVAITLFQLIDLVADASDVSSYEDEDEAG